MMKMKWLEYANIYEELGQKRNRHISDSESGLQFFFVKTYF